MIPFLTPSPSPLSYPLSSSPLSPILSHSPPFPLTPYPPLFHLISGTSPTHPSSSPLLHILLYCSSSLGRLLPIPHHPPYSISSSISAHLWDVSSPSLLHILLYFSSSLGRLLPILTPYPPLFQLISGTSPPHPYSISSSIAAHLWDVSGQESFINIAKKHITDADGVVFLYDVTDIHSFTNLTQWLSVVNRCNRLVNVPKILLGNKMDLRHHQTVSAASAKEFAIPEGMSHMEVGTRQVE